MGSIDFEVIDHVATVVLNNPDRRNAVDAPMRDGLDAAYERIRIDEDIRVVVMHGEGDKAFCAGGDISAYQAAGSFGPQGSGPPPIPRPWPIWKPFIAAIQGYAVGGGFALALTCDLRIVGRSAQIGPSGLKRGAVQGAGQSQRLPRLIGASKALELLLLSTYVSGEEAAHMGLANAAVDDDQVLSTAHEWASVIASHSPWAVQQTKKLTWGAFDQPLEEGLSHESEVALEGYRSEAAQAGFSAFLERPRNQR